MATMVKHMAGAIPAKEAKCTFYGHSITSEDFLVPTAFSNQCALISLQLQGHCPCLLETDGLEVNWDQCLINPVVRYRPLR